MNGFSAEITSASQLTTKPIRFSEHPTQPRKARIASSEWEKFRSVIVREYARDDLDLGKAAHVVHYMQVHHNFIAKEHDFMYRLNKWRKEGAVLLNVSCGTTSLAVEAVNDANSIDHARNSPPLIEQDSSREDQISAYLTDGVVAESSGDRHSTIGPRQHDGCASNPPATDRVSDQAQVAKPSEDHHDRKRGPSPNSSIHGLTKKRVSDGSTGLDRTELFQAASLQAIDPPVTTDSPSIVRSTVLKPSLTYTEAIHLGAWSRHMNLLLPEASHLSMEAWVTWCEVAGLESISWAELAEVRRGAEVYCACSLFSIAFRLHYLVYERLSISEDCDWGKLAHLRYRQLIYCVRCATSTEELRVARTMVEGYLKDAIPTNGITHRLPTLRICLSEILRKQNQEVDASVQLSTAFRDMVLAKESAQTPKVIEDTDIFINFKHAHARTLQRVLAASFPHDGAVPVIPAISDRITETKGDDPADISQIDAIFYAFYEWCSRKIVRSGSGSWDRFSPSGQPPYHHTRSSTQYMNILHLFNFLWSHEDLFTFSKMLESRWVDCNDDSMVRWLRMLRKQHGACLADIIWTVARTLVVRSDAALHTRLRTELQDEIVRIVDNLSHLSIMRMCAMLRENVLQDDYTELALDQSPVFDEAVGMVSRLTLAMAAISIPQEPLLVRLSNSPSQDLFMRTMASSLCSSTLSTMRRVERPSPPSVVEKRPPPSKLDPQEHEDNWPWDIYFTDGETNVETLEVEPLEVETTNKVMLQILDTVPSVAANCPPSPLAPGSRAAVDEGRGDLRSIDEMALEDDTIDAGHFTPLTNVDENIAARIEPKEVALTTCSTHLVHNSLEEPKSSLLAKAKSQHNAINKFAPSFDIEQPFDSVDNGYQ